MSIKKSLPLIGSIFTFLLLSVFVFNGCESSRVGPEIARPNPPAPVALPTILTGYVKDLSDNSAIAGATVKISKADKTVVTTLLTDNSGKYSYDVTSLTDATLLVDASKNGYGFSSRIAEINKANRMAVVGDVLIQKLVVYSAPVTPAAGGTVSAPVNTTQTTSTTPLTVTVPPNSVPSNVTLTVAPILASQAPPPTNASTSILSAAQFGPSGTVFAVPVTVKFPLSAPLDPGSTINLQKLNETTNVWEPSGIIGTVDATGLVATAQLTSFSSWMVWGIINFTLNEPGTTTSVDVETISSSGSSLNKTYAVTNSATGTLNRGALIWAYQEVAAKAKVSIGLGSFTTTLPVSFGFPTIPAEYLNNGVQYNPAKPNEAGNWNYQWVVKRETLTRTWSVSGAGVVGNGTISTQTIKSTGSWVWVAHGQGGVN